MKNFIIYLHRSNITNKIFYVGCTSHHKRRPYRTDNRTKRWNEVSSLGYSVEIIATNLTEELAFELEEFLISEYGRECDGGILVNVSKGGKNSLNGVSETLKNIPRTKELKEKVSKANSGSKNGMFGKPSINRKKVINTETGEIFDSIKLAAESINISMKLLSAYLRKKATNKTKFEYLD